MSFLTVVPYALEADFVSSCVETGVVCLCPTYQALQAVGLLCQCVILVMHPPDVEDLKYFQTLFIFISKKDSCLYSNTFTLVTSIAGCSCARLGRWWTALLSAQLPLSLDSTA